MSDYQVHALVGSKHLFYVNNCQTDRVWRKQLLLAGDKFQKGEFYHFDECKNAFTKPKAPQFIDVLDHLHKLSDYNWCWHKVFKPTII